MRFVALDKQHEHIKEELTEAFARLLRTSAYTLGSGSGAVRGGVRRLLRDRRMRGCLVGNGGARRSCCGPRASARVMRSIVPAHTFIASALGAVHAGATPVLCDVDEATGLIDPEAARAAITPRTAAIVAVHLYGQMCDMDAIAEVAEPRGLFVLEDAAQAHGALYKGRRAGSLGAAGAFSFYPSKNLGALGDGGAVCTDDEMLAARLRRLRNLGQRTKGEHVEFGFNERLDGLQAALLRVKLPHLDAWNERAAHAAPSATAICCQSDVTLLAGAAREPVCLSPHAGALRKPRRGRGGVAHPRNRDRYPLRPRDGLVIPRSRASPPSVARFPPRRPGQRRSCRSRCTLTSARTTWVTSPKP